MEITPIDKAKMMGLVPLILFPKTNKINESGIKKILAWGTSNYDSKANSEYDD